MKTSRSGFSLIEVALALVVAAGGLLSVFSLFPLGLRQSANTKSDLTQFTFANTVLETIAGNVSQIDDIATWNDPESWWAIAVAGTGLPGKSQLISAKDMYNKYDSSKNGGKWDSTVEYKGFPSIATVEIARGSTVPNGKAWYVGQELDEFPDVPGLSEIACPPQYLIRLFQVESKISTGLRDDVDSSLAEDNVTVYRPCRYVVSLISSDHLAPNIFTHELIYSQEFSFLHRP